MSSTSTEIERRRSGEARRGEAVPGMGLLKGLGVTIKQLFTRAATQHYPHEQPDLAPRTRGVIGLMDENCTVCMLCARECPDWCIYIDSHKETVPPAKEGGRERTRNVLDRFAIDFALCMYCGICIEVCPFDALFWSPRFDYATYEIDGLLHEKEKLREWMDTVPPPPPLEDGAEPPKEVADALEQAERELEKAREQRRRELEQAESGQAPAQADRAEAPEARAEPVQIEGAGEELDQDVYDRLIEEGKSERIARAKAKAAWVRAQKKTAREAAAEGVEDEGPAPLVALDLEGAGEELDQQVYDELVEAGTSERVAGARAKAAWIVTQMQARVQGDGQAGGGEVDTDQATGEAAGETTDEATDETTDEATDEATGAAGDGEQEDDEA